MDDETISEDIKGAYCALHGEHYWSEEHCKESYYGIFDTYDEASQHIVDEFVESYAITAPICYYLDEKAVLRDLLIETYNIVEYEHMYYIFYKI